MTTHPNPLEDLEALRKVAEEATQAEWKDVQGTGCVFADGRTVAQCYWLSGSDQDPDANARFIATFDPPTVLALLSELEAVKGENASLKASRELAPTTCRGDGQEAATPPCFNQGE